MAKTTTGSRTGGRSARRALRTANDFTMMPGLKRNIPECEVMDGSQVERIDAVSAEEEERANQAAAALLAAPATGTGATR